MLTQKIDLDNWNWDIFNEKISNISSCSDQNQKLTTLERLYGFANYQSLINNLNPYPSEQKELIKRYWQEHKKTGNHNTNEDKSTKAYQLATISALAPGFEAHRNLFSQAMIDAPETSEINIPFWERVWKKRESLASHYVHYLRYLVIMAEVKNDPLPQTMALQEEGLSKKIMTHFSIYLKNNFCNQSLSHDDYFKNLSLPFSKLKISKAIEILEELFTEDKLIRFLPKNPLAENIKGSFTIAASTYRPKIIMKWDGSWMNLLTLAHEVGHCLHFERYYKDKEVNSKRPSAVLSEAIAFSYEMKAVRYLEKLLNISIESNYRVKMIWKLQILSKFEKETINAIATGKIPSSDCLSAFYTESFYNVTGLKLNDKLLSNQWAYSHHIFRPHYSLRYTIAFLLSLNTTPKEALDLYGTATQSGTFARQMCE